MCSNCQGAELQTTSAFTSLRRRCCEFSFFNETVIFCFRTDKNFILEPFEDWVQSMKHCVMEIGYC